MNYTCSDLLRLPCRIVEVLGGVQGVYRLIKVTNHLSVLAVHHPGY